jgi:MFS superfamily sulfate permease-like transporter
MAALVGVMMMVAISTFQWVSIRIVNKMPKSDIFVGITVALITIVLHNLALAVLVGVIISALVFAGTMRQEFVPENIPMKTESNITRFPDRYFLHLLPLLQINLTR